MQMRSIYLLAVLALTLSVLSTSCEKDVFGCMDPASDNYNPDANMDSGDCKYSGCTDPTSATYNPKANVDDGSCEYRGCTDPQSVNYDARATIDDGSCEYEGCMDPNSLNYDAQATIDDGSCMYARDAFVGTYNATEQCPAGTFTWVLTITEDPDDTGMVILTNLGGFNTTIKATVDGDTLTFDDTDSLNITYKGTATLTGNELTSAYNATDPGASIDCTFTATKQ